MPHTIKSMIFRHMPMRIGTFREGNTEVSPAAIRVRFVID